MKPFGRKCSVVVEVSRSGLQIRMRDSSVLNTQNEGFYVEKDGHAPLEVANVGPPFLSPEACHPRLFEKKALGKYNF